MSDIKLIVLQGVSQNKIKKLEEIVLENIEKELCLNRNNIKKIFKCGIDTNIYTLEIIINKEEVSIEIDGLDYVNIKSEKNRNIKIENISIINSRKNCTITNVDVEKMNVENSNIILSNDKINELNIGLGTMIDAIRSEDVIYSYSELICADIKDCKINNMYIYGKSLNISISDTKIKKVILENKGYIDNFQIKDNSSIEKLLIYGIVKRNYIENVYIDDFVFSSNGKIDRLDISTALITHTFGCKINSINNKTEETWKLLMDSAKNNNDSLLYSKAGFEYMKSKRQSSGKRKFMDYVMEKICGYGYKPFNTIMTSFYIWIVFGFMYWCIGLLGEKSIMKDGKNVDIIHCFYFSIITFTTTGFGDIIPTGILAMILSGIEAALGISLISLFIFTMTKRYGGFK